MSLMERGRPGNSVFTWGPQEFPRGHSCEEKSRTQYSRLLGWYSISRHHAPNFSVIVATSTLTGSSRVGPLMSWLKREQKRMRDHFARTIFLEVEVCERIDCAKRFPTALTHRWFRSAIFLIAFTIKSAMKLVVVPSMTMGLCFCLAAFLTSLTILTLALPFGLPHVIVYQKKKKNKIQCNQISHTLDVMATSNRGHAMYTANKNLTRNES